MLLYLQWFWTFSATPSASAGTFISGSGTTDVTQTTGSSPNRTDSGGGIFDRWIMAEGNFDCIVSQLIKSARFPIGHDGGAYKSEYRSHG
jgi:hypothetical protein